MAIHIVSASLRRADRFEGGAALDSMKQWCLSHPMTAASAARIEPSINMMDFAMGSSHHLDHVCILLIRRGAAAAAELLYALPHMLEPPIGA